MIHVLLLHLFSTNQIFIVFVYYFFLRLIGYEYATLEIEIKIQTAFFPLVFLSNKIVLCAVTEKRTFFSQSDKFSYIYLFESNETISEPIEHFDQALVVFMGFFSLI